MAEPLRRKTKMTRMTSPIVISSVNWTSAMDSRIVLDRSKWTSSFRPAGIRLCSAGSSSRIPSTTATVFVPGCLRTASTTALIPLRQKTLLSFCTLSITLASCSSRMGAPWR